MTSNFPLLELSDKDLADLQRAVSREIRRREKKKAEAQARESKGRLNEARAAAEAAARKYGFKFGDLVDGAGPDAPKTRRKWKDPSVVYVHPNNPDLIFKGRGRKPFWLVELMEAGHTLASLARMI